MNKKLFIVILIIITVLVYGCDKQHNMVDNGDYYVNDVSISDDEIIIIGQNPDNGLYVAELECGGWRVILLLIAYENGQIELIQEIGEANRNTTSMVSLKGFDENFIQTYETSNMGNGGMKLITFDKSARIVGQFFVSYYRDLITIDFEILNKYNITENDTIRYKFGEADDNDSTLYPNYIDLNNDGYDDIQFLGIQTVINTERNEILDQFNVRLNYLYDPISKTFILSHDDSILPKMWGED